MTKRRMEYLKPAEYQELRRQAPIAYIPWGAHEWHGVHNPLGTIQAALAETWKP